MDTQDVEKSLKTVDLFATSITDHTTIMRSVLERLARDEISEERAHNLCLEATRSLKRVFEIPGEKGIRILSPLTDNFCKLFWGE
jgi:hypothetical protein